MLKKIFLSTEKIILVVSYKPTSQYMFHIFFGIAQTL